MENLSRIARGIFLGNGEIWNFLDHTVNRNCGGLLYKTQQLGLLDKNFTKNFNGGHKRKYNYEGEDTDNIPSFNAYGINPHTGKIFSTDLTRNIENSPHPIHGGGGNLGDLYTVPEEEKSSNSALNFIIKENFKALGEEIRKNNVKLNKYRESYKDTDVKFYAGEIDDKYKNTHLPQTQVGDYVSVDKIRPINIDYTLESFGDEARNYNLREKINVEYRLDTLNNNILKYKLFVSDNSIRNDKIFSKVSERTFMKLKLMDDVASEKREKIDNYQYASERFLNLASKKVKLNDGVTFGGLFDEYETKNEKDLLKITVNNNGLKDYYKSEREKYNSKLRGIKYPWEDNGFWSFKKQYGISVNVSNNETSDYYKVGEKNIYEGNVNISDNGDSHIQFNPRKGIASYSYFQEAEKGVVPSKLETDIYQGSSVSLSNYEGASRLLQRTNELFRNAKISSLINRFHTSDKIVDSELISSFDNEFGMSRGRNLIREQYEGKTSGDISSGYDNPYCRVWTAHHQYSKLKDRIRPFVDDNGSPLSISDTQSNFGGLRSIDGITNLETYSVLRKDGYLKMGPTHENGLLFQKEDHLKNYMFSIENLAWKDITVDKTNTSLSKEQKGPNGGRIMWFPPYNLKFTENINVNWNANNFIGRGEEIYSYTNTVRTGTLDFTILIDHPSIINKWRGTSEVVAEKEKRERDLLRFFAGCGNINDEVSPTNPVKESKENNEENPNIDTKPTYYTKDIAYVVFFPNNFSGQDYTKDNLEEGIDIISEYNSGGSVGEKDTTFKDEVLKPYNNISTGFTPSNEEELIRKTLFGGDEDIEIRFLGELKDIAQEFNGSTMFGGVPRENCEIQSVDLRGFASSHGYESNNKILCSRRSNFMQKLLEHYSVEFGSNTQYNKISGGIINVPNVDDREDVNVIEAKIGRAAYAIIHLSWKEDNVAHEGNLSDGSAITVAGMSLDSTEKTNKTERFSHSNAVISTTYYDSEEYTYDNEYLYFSELRGDSLVYKNIMDKVRYFDPAFHSITPEGFNARLTFLHQCTRQGPTNAVSSGRVKGVKRDKNGKIIDEGSSDYLKFAGNLAFGRAPYCILRIGDFFNTKICIDSMSINYDNNGGVQWDLNPEGVGVQPMYANVSITFKFLGGQDISRPIERLQNAVTSNYYANASVYSRHADNSKFYYDAFEDNPKYKNKTIE